MRRRLLVLVSVAALSLAAELPVRDVVLYKNGVGYFQRSGPVRPGEAVRLDFRASEMNDVLKSLTVLEEGGGKIGGLRYDSSEPLARILAEFPFKIGDGQPLPALLDQLKGARIELRFAGESVAGVILGARIAPGGEKQPEQAQLTLLLDSGEVRTFDLAAATALRFTEPELQNQMKQYLASVARGRSQEKRSVYIESSGGGQGRISVSYAAQVPVWKSSYRLILRDTSEPLLEGWAMVDNTSGEDWSGVRLALVSGRPTSFISRLYEPRYVTRPIAELPEEQVASPVIHGGALEEAKGLHSGIGGMPASAPPPAPAAAMLKARPMAGFQAAAAERMDISSSIAEVPEAGERGELFEYRFPSPVTVRKSESVMLPFVRSAVNGRKLLILSDPGAQHPWNAVELTNSTGKTLDGGPVTVYDGDTYAGEALMETLKAADKRLVSYAVDLGTRVSTRFDSSRDLVREIHLRRGVLTTRAAIQETRVFTIRNADQKAKTLVLETPARQGYKLLNQKPSETTASAYRFEVKLAAGATEKFSVSEERLLESSLMLVNLTPDLLASYIENKAVSEAARAQLQRIAQQKSQIASADAEIRRTEETRNELRQDQDRLRQNIMSLSNVAGQQEQTQLYARQLAAQEAQMAALRDRLSELRKRKATLEAELNSWIEKMEF